MRGHSTCASWATPEWDDSQWMVWAGELRGPGTHRLLGPGLDPTPHPLTPVINCDALTATKNELETFLIDFFSFQHLFHVRIIYFSLGYVDPLTSFLVTNTYVCVVCVR